MTPTDPVQEIPRSVSRIVTASSTREGGGFLVHRPFPTGDLREFDPFLLLDEMGPVDYRPGEAVGAPDHPHRGFETVTYLLEGAMQHKDSGGHKGKLRPGDVQWMTAGSGVIHSELPDPAFLEKGGKAHGFQLWVNLPRKDKMMLPRYQEIPAERIPVAQSPDGKVMVRIIAGESFGQKAVIETRTPIFYLHFTLQPGGQVSQTIPGEFNVFAYVVSGNGLFGPESVPATRHQMVLFEHDGHTLRFSQKGDSPLTLLLIGGIPINEPIVRYGPFVMNTEQEIHQAIDDYRNGRMGDIRP
ncbi:MAG: pirin family protein [Leptospirales bacterium]